jgi:hypothetical protein
MHDPLTLTSRRCRPKDARNTATLLQTSVTFPIFPRRVHWFESMYMRRSKTDIVFATIRSRYGFLVTESSGKESSFGAGMMRVPNQDRFFSLSTCAKDNSSSSWQRKASSKRFIPLNDAARLSCTGRGVTGHQTHGLVCRTFRMKNVQKFQPGIDCWLSDRLTSSSLEETAVSKADKIPSFTFESSSAQAAGLSLATGQASCTHLQTICNTQPYARQPLWSIRACPVYPY